MRVDEADTGVRTRAATAREAATLVLVVVATVDATDAAPGLVVVADVGAAGAATPPPAAAPTASAAARPAAPPTLSTRAAWRDRRAGCGLRRREAGMPHTVAAAG